MATNTKTAAVDTPAGTDMQDVQEAMRYTLLEAPIAELAAAEGVSIDEAVGLRVAAMLDTVPINMEVTVRPIEPKGKLIGFASVNFGGVVVDDFKVFDGEKGLFVGNPSKPDNSTRSGFRSTARVIDKELQGRLNEAAAVAYVAEVEKLQARAAAVRAAPEKPPIRVQLQRAAQEAAKDNAARPAQTKETATRDDAR